MSTVLQVAGLNAFYGQAQVLCDLELSVQAGQSVALLGRNGAGKTSLLHSLFNIGPSWQGTIHIHGQAIAQLPTYRIARLGLALVPQGRGVFNTLSVSESLRLAQLHPGTHPPLVKLADIYADMPRLYERRHQNCANLSGGERQLLALARALLTQSRTIVLDEPSEGLAPMTISDVLLPQLRQLQARGYTLILAEQNASLALSLATRVLVLLNGRLVFDGSVHEWQQHTHLQQQYLGVGL